MIAVAQAGNAARRSACGKTPSQLRFPDDLSAWKFRNLGSSRLERLGSQAVSSRGNDLRRRGAGNDRVHPPSRRRYDLHWIRNAPAAHSDEVKAGSDVRRARVNGRIATRRIGLYGAWMRVAGGRRRQAQAETG